MEQQLKERVNDPELKQARTKVAGAVGRYVLQHDAGIRDEGDQEVLDLCREALDAAGQAHIGSHMDEELIEMLDEAAAAWSRHKLYDGSLEEAQRLSAALTDHIERHTDRFDGVAFALRQKGFVG